MQFSLVALLAATAAAVPFNSFNSSIEARGLNQTSTLLPRGLNVTHIVEPRGLNDSSTLLSRGLNDTSVLLGRSANITVRSYNVTKRDSKSATFPKVNLPEPISGVFEGNKKISALPNKTTEAGVKRSYGSFGTGSGEDPQRQDAPRRANDTAALTSPPQPPAPVSAVIPEPPTNATTPSPWKSPLRRLQRHFRRQQLRFQAQAQDQTESQNSNASAASTQKRKANANAAPAAAACASSGMDVWNRCIF